ncbi:KipI family sensor histidine kinase inhibitor [Pseudomonas duriflava]|uniref:KipI family sensor histidine kinase inhibitor n=1 Tax=Pseudomonas duriflava TaxID=459528 RepID=A0A562QDI1_9PSED|nr:5-oxoprolinase subunit PxpB [Pseudomonas duriflava]TWI54808.1 KipI family sensor histidine kinase inhibitor [Pseudomonas duriflava]
MIRIEPFGAEALMLTLADTPKERLPGRIAQLADNLSQALGDALIDLVPGWTTLLIHYDVMQYSLSEIQARVMPVIEDWHQESDDLERVARLHEIPVWYAGPDLESVAKACSLAVEQVIDLHSRREYRVGAIGFAPGFPYLGELDERLVLPRLASPRVRVEAGSVAIAERQTAIYPQASPGGWHVLGFSAWRLFDPQAEPPCPLAAGDRVRFIAVDEATYRAEGGQAAWD